MTDAACCAVFSGAQPDGSDPDGVLSCVQVAAVVGKIGRRDLDPVFMASPENRTAAAEIPAGTSPK